MNKTRLFYDFLTVILIAWIGFTFFGPKQISVESFLFSSTYLLIVLAYSWVYAIAIIVLITKINESTPAKVIQISSAIIIGFFILPFILPLLYYLIILRKRL